MRILVVINDRSGSGDAGIYDFLRRAGLAGNELVVRYILDDLRAEDLVSDYSHFDRIVVAGGDGTVSAVCYAIRGSQSPVLAYPAGTANLLSANLGLPTEAAALAEVLIHGRPVDFDLGELESVGDDGSTRRTGFALMAGAGYDAEIMHGADSLKPTLGAAAYLVAALGNMMPTPAKLTLRLDDTTVETEGIAVLVANFARIQFELPLTPGTDPTDGVFEIAVATGRSVAGILPAVAAALLDRSGDFPDRGPAVSIYTASTIAIASDPPLRIQSDGDPLGTTTPLTVRVLPKATTLLVGKSSPYWPAD